MRIVAGAAKGRRLSVPPTGVRPTPDRVREALFSSLATIVGDATMLDLFAGSGAVGLEALSRGAKSVTFVEHDAKTVAILRSNIAAVGDADTRVVTTPAERFLQQPPATAYTLVFMDAPYDVPTRDIEAYLSWLTPHLANDAMVIVERGSKQDPPTFPNGFSPPQMKRYGSVMLYRATWTTGGSVTADRETVETS